MSNMDMNPTEKDRKHLALATEAISSKTQESSKPSKPLPDGFVSIPCPVSIDDSLVPHLRWFEDMTFLNNSSRETEMIDILADSGKVPSEALRIAFKYKHLNLNILTKATENGKKLVWVIIRFRTDNYAIIYGSKYAFPSEVHAFIEYSFNEEKRKRRLLDTELFPPMTEPFKEDSSSGEKPIRCLLKRIFIDGKRFIIIVTPDMMGLDSCYVNNATIALQVARLLKKDAANGTYYLHGSMSYESSYLTQMTTFTKIVEEFVNFTKARDDWTGPDRADEFRSLNLEKMIRAFNGTLSDLEEMENFAVLLKELEEKGAIYDDGGVTYVNRDVKINGECLTVGEMIISMISYYLVMNVPHNQNVPHIRQHDVFADGPFTVTEGVLRYGKQSVWIGYGPFTITPSGNGCNKITYTETVEGCSGYIWKTILGNIPYTDNSKLTWINHPIFRIFMRHERIFQSGKSFTGENFRLAAQNTKDPEYLLLLNSIIKFLKI